MPKPAPLVLAVLAALLLLLVLRDRGEQAPASVPTAPASTQPAPLAPQGPLSGPYAVDSIVDGDTVRLRMGGAIETVRLIGVDTPETVHPRVGVEPYGPEASDLTKRLLSERTVLLERDLEPRDRYGRLLAYLYYPDPEGEWSIEGRNYSQANLEIAESGYAEALTISPNVRYSSMYLDAVRAARATRQGMWEEAVPAAEAPFDPTGVDRDCGDFESQAEAQAFFEAAGPGDPHRLDSDDNGLACESLAQAG